MELWGIAFYAVALYIVFLRYLGGRHYNYSRTLFISPSTCCLIILCAKSFYAYTSVYLICEGIFYLITAWRNVENKCYLNLVPLKFLSGSNFAHFLRMGPNWNTLLSYLSLVILNRIFKLSLTWYFVSKFILTYCEKKKVFLDH